MKILQLIPNFGSGGAEHFVVELSNELCLIGHQVEVLTLCDVPENNHLKKILNSGVKINSLHKKSGLDFRIFYYVWKYVNQYQFDVVHAHVGAIKYMSLATFFCGKVRFVATIHSEAKREAGKSLDKWSRKLMFGFKKCIPVTISYESERSFEKYYGREGIMIFNGVSDYVKKRDFQLRDNVGQIVFLHPASCQPIKNQHLLFSAFNKLLNNGYDVKIIWVGGNKVYRELYTSLKPLIKDNVTYLGVVDNVRDYMAVSDAICLSSIMEGMPMTVIEAFSVGCPALCTPVGGLINMIQNGVNGMLSNSLSEEDYYTMLKQFCDLSPAEKNKMRKKAKESAELYSIETTANRYLQVYGLE